MTEVQHIGDMTPTPAAEIVNRIYAVTAAVNGVTNSWAIYLAAPNFDEEPELRNRLFGLLVCGLVDACEEYRPRIRGLEIDAKKRGVLAAPYYLDLLSRYLDLALDLVGIFSPNEMVLISELRNQWLHGHWEEIHKTMRSMRYVKEGRVTRQKIPATEYNEIFRNGLLPHADAALEPLRATFCNYRTFFWTMDRVFNMPEVQKFMRGDLLLGTAFKTPRILLEFPDPSFRPNVYNETFASLFEIVSMIAAEDRRKDPVVGLVR